MPDQLYCDEDNDDDDDDDNDNDNIPFTPGNCTYKSGQTLKLSLKAVFINHTIYKFNVLVAINFKKESFGAP